MQPNTSLSDTLQARGGRLTRQRRLILEIMQESSGHLDAETVFLEAKKRDTRISFATVYRSLALLKEAGLIEEHRFGEDHGHFEACQAKPHFHFTCLGCGQVIELDAPQIVERIQALSECEGLQMTTFSLEMKGYCLACRGK
jgi:Fe2+ or Zn2+ uptake regulation protein